MAFSGPASNQMVMDFGWSLNALRFNKLTLFNSP
jgi:hypothetical protein